LSPRAPRRPPTLKNSRAERVAVERSASGGEVGMVHAFSTDAATAALPPVWKAIGLEEKGAVRAAARTAPRIVAIAEG